MQVKAKAVGSAKRKLEVERTRAGAGTDDEMARKGEKSVVPLQRLH